jgi:hypothetical protein
MRIGGIYSFKDGEKVIESRYPKELMEIKQTITEIDATQYKTKSSREKTMPGKMLYSPIRLNKAFVHSFELKGWQHNYRVWCEYPTEYYTSDYSPPAEVSNAYREMDFVKNKVGIEVQFGKYAFMVYNVAAKMTIFRNLGIIEAGVEIVPLKELAEQMSTGVSYFLAQRPNIW